MCKNIRKNEDKPPAFLLYYYQKLNLKIKKPTAVSRKERQDTR